MKKVKMSKIISCDCFDTISKNVEEGLGNPVELSLMIINSETLENRTLFPVVYFKAGKQYVHMKAKFCPRCGKEIIIED